MEKIPMTPEGAKKLENELRDLKMIERPNIIKAISEARALGDLSENAEYHYAKDKQGFIEGRISQLEATLSMAEIIDITKLTGEDVKFGSTITILDLDTNVETKYKIVGVDQADISAGYLSVKSPLARALIGKKINDEINLNTPRGSKTYEIIDIQYV